MDDHNLQSEPFADFFTEEHFRRRRQAMAKYSGWEGADDLDPKGPCSHAKGFETSTRLTQYVKRTHFKNAVDISPQDVIDVLVAAGIKNWVLMGLHGYVGYLPQPRATQDVDIMVPYSQRKPAMKAICQAWPELDVHELSQVVRFLDPNDLDHQGRPKPVIDLMMPWGKFQETILAEFVCVDEATQHRIPQLEAAIASKYAAMISVHRDRDRKEQDAVDFRRIVRANVDAIRREELLRLANEIWDGGGEEMENFLKIAMSDQPFPV